MELDSAALYDLLNPWDPDTHPGDRFYFGLLMAAPSVLDVGCGTGAMLHLIRDRGHDGRLVGLDPDRPSLERARRRTDVEWIEGTAADAPRRDFALATMTGHAFQCLVTDADVRTSLAAVHAALGPGGRFVFETRHPQARAWEGWDVSDPDDVAVVTDATGRELKVWHTVDEVAGDATGKVVTFRETTARPDGTVLGVDQARLRFLDVPALNAFLAEAGFTIEAQYGDWDRSPIGPTSREIITIARR